MEEKIHVEFSGVEFDKIMQYADLIDAVTVQAAIMNAISIALDEKNQ